MWSQQQAKPWRRLIKAQENTHSKNSLFHPLENTKKYIEDIDFIKNYVMRRKLHKFDVISGYRSVCLKDFFQFCQSIKKKKRKVPPSP